MFLRSLSMRGFKSFADKTVLDVEPGITVIVGPNGSGKSNVVDALAWVLGTHSAKKVRGGSMSDVIFAGSPHRTRARQARVEIVIDNADGQLSGGVGTAASAGEFSEVRVARVIDHDGEATYEIGGQDVRALDVQELLSDTGLGRELHTVVGQGQLDEILNARPEERRRYIEEAAGILKHRRRRERALRKLEQVDQHIDKLRTVLRELRRQLRPLERQAEAADRHATLQAELRQVHLALAARELVQLRRQRDEITRGGAELESRLDHLQEQLDARAQRVATLSEQESHLDGEVERAAARTHRLASLAERIRGTSELVEARRRHLIEYAEQPLAGRPPDELRAQADRLLESAGERERECAEVRDELEQAVSARRSAEAERREHEQQIEAERRRRAEQREHVLRWEGEVSALRGAIANTEAELGKVESALVAIDNRIGEAETAAGQVRSEIEQLDTREVELTESLEEAEARVGDREGELEALRDQIRQLEAEHASQRARAEALRAALDESEGGAGALLAAGQPGVLGRVADHVRVDPSAAGAVAAALGQLGEAVLAESTGAAANAVAWLRGNEAGRAVVVGTDSVPQRTPLDADTRERISTMGARPLASVVEPGSSPIASRVHAMLTSWLTTTFLARDWTSAVRLHQELPRLTFVTAQGDIAGPWGYRASGSSDRSAVTTAVAADAADQRAAEITTELATLRERSEAAEQTATAARQDLVRATERINESDARITGAAERLSRIGKELDSLASQREILRAQHAELTEVLSRDRTALSELHGRGPEQQTEPDEFVADDATVVELDAQVEQARERELAARVRLERVTEQVRHLQAQADAARQEADEVEAALAEAARRRELRRIGIERCAELAVVVRELLGALERASSAADEDRQARSSELTGCRQELAAAREAQQQLQAERDELRDSRHDTDLRRADVDGRLASLTMRIESELATTADEIAGEHPDAETYDVGELTERQEVIDRRLGMLGRVNPLALEEFRALEERHAFLTEQLGDLRRSRKDLEEVVTAVDERIREVFKAAFDDVAREFELTFSTVFPGGEGRLVMTDADDLLNAGVEVEARPPGKRITRLSLLSGGERSLTVLAFVFAIFRARPSPFYVLDEVDAALDDVNLQRLLRVVRSFRGHAQIIMVTHQKRTMEIADVLYGITMGPDGVTKVVAERLDDAASDAPTQLLAGAGSSAGGEA